MTADTILYTNHILSREANKSYGIGCYAEKFVFISDLFIWL